MSTLTGRQFHLVSRPTGWPTEDNFRLVEVPVRDPAAGQVLVRNRYLSVDPYMRGRMNDLPSYVPPYQLNESMGGGAVGEVLESNDPGLRPGDYVVHNKGWREYAVVDAARVRAVDAIDVPLPAYLGALGMPGFTAYVGLLTIAEMKPGDVVFVSAAAGAVGGVAGQIAKLRGASCVVGSAGSRTKIEHLVNDLGFDAAFNYRQGDIRGSLRTAAPDGIDVYFDNVGGEHLTAALSALRTHGRVAMCGAISQYNEERPVPGPPNLPLMIGKRLALRGFIVGDHTSQMPAFEREMTQWLASGKIRFDSTVVDGLERMPAAFLAMLRGENTGKMLIRIG